MLVAFAHSPVLRAPLLSSDYRHLLGETLAPLETLWARLDRALEGPPPPGESALALRLPILLLLGLAALFQGLCFERLLESRLGARAAQAAALAAAGFTLVHPAILQCVAAIPGRAELAGMTLGLLGLYAFLRGRQEERGAFTACSLLAFVAAGSAASSAACLAGPLALAEFAAVRRHRRRTVRLRTATTSLIVYGAAAALPSLLTAATGSSPAFQGSGSIVAEAGAALARLVLPSSDGASTLHGLLAATAILVAAHPVVGAARNAPRLWGRLLLVLAAVQLVTLACSTVLGRGLLSLVTWTSALGLSVTARADGRRAWLAATVALCLAILAHLESRPILSAARAQGGFAAQLLPVLREHPGPLLVLDPPAAAVRPPLARSLGWCFHPSLGGTAGAPFDPERVRVLSSAAFLCLASSPAAASFRATRPTVVVESLDGRGGVQAVPLEPGPAPEGQVIVWDPLTYPLPTALDPLDWEFARFTADVSTAAREIELLGWDDGAGARSLLVGSVSEKGGRRVAEFDLSSSLRWRLSSRIRSVRVEQGVRDIERGELLARLPELEVSGPIVAGDDWLFEPGPSVAEAPPARLVLTLLATEDFELLELPVERDSPSRLRARGAQTHSARKGSPLAPVVWLLDSRAGERTLSRARGTAP